MVSRGTETGAELVPATRGVPVVADSPEMRDWAEQLVARARSEGIELSGDNGLLTAIVRRVLQTGLNVELGEHLGYEPYDPARRGPGNNRNGSYPKTVTTEIGEVEIDMPRDRLGTFEPATVPKHVRRIDGLTRNVNPRQTRYVCQADVPPPTASSRRTEFHPYSSLQLASTRWNRWTGWTRSSWSADCSASRSMARTPRSDPRHLRRYRTDPATGDLPSDLGPAHRVIRPLRGERPPSVRHPRSATCVPRTSSAAGGSRLW